MLMEKRLLFIETLPTQEVQEEQVYVFSVIMSSDISRDSFQTKQSINL